MADDQQVTVAVTRDEQGGVSVGPEVVAPAGLASCPVRGGLLLVDPASPATSPRLLVHDPSELDVVALLFGDVVADAVDRAASLTEPSTSLAPVVATEDLGTTAALALWGWLRESCVVPYDLPLLDLEVSLSATRASSPLEVSPEGRPLVDWAATLLVWGRRAVSAPSSWGPGSPAAAVLESALSALGADPQVASGPGAELRALASSLRRATADESPTSSPGWDELLDDLRPVGASQLGDEAGLSWARAVAADWPRVPPTVSRSEHAVSWRVEDTRGGRVLGVVVDLAASSPHAELLAGVGVPQAQAAHLRATLHHEAWPLPLVSTPLVLETETRGWMGSVVLDADLARRLDQLGAAGVVVDVHREGWRSPPLVGARARVAQARRWAARGVATARLAASLPADQVAARTLLDDNARQSFARAARLYAADSPGSAQVRSCAHLAATDDAVRRPRPGEPTEPAPATPTTALPRLADLGLHLSATEAWYAQALVDVGPGGGR